MNTLIKNIRLIMPDAVLKGYGVVFSEGKITDIDLEENINLQLIDKIIDGEGQFLSPGFLLTFIIMVIQVMILWIVEKKPLIILDSFM